MNHLIPPIHESDHFLGNRGSPAVLVEYGDFECPYCGQAYGVLKNLEKELGDAMALVFRHFPLTQVHPHALQAAEASEAAGALGNFWGYHDLLFENQDRLSYPDLKLYAQQLQLDEIAFDNQMRRNIRLRHVREHISSGVRSGVNGTPTFFINEQRYDGPTDVASLLDAIGRLVRI
jgi:protein-disulfide isomerase